MTAMNDLGERIRLLREATGITQTDLAQLVGISRAAVSQWESGHAKSLKGENLYKAAKALGVEPGALLIGPLPRPDLTLEQQQLVAAFGKLSAAHKDLVMHIIKSLN